MTTAATAPVNVSCAVRDNLATITVVGEIAYSNRAMISGQVDLALGARVSEIAIDLARCTSIDSAGMGTLISASKKAREKGCRIRLESLSPDLREVLKQTRLETLFDWPESPGDSPDSDPHGAHHG